MPHDVSVSSLVPPKFPDRCVLCGAAEPGRQVRFSAGAKYGAFFFLSWFGKGKRSILAPACGTCAVSAMSRALMRFALSAAGAALAAWFLFAAMKKGGRGLFKLKAIAVFFAAVIPAVVWDWLFPAKFSVTFNDENHTTVCHFYDPGYAAHFDALNHFDAPDDQEQPDSPPVVQPSPGRSQPSFGDYRSAASFEDTSNPYRNLEDPRFKK